MNISGMPAYAFNCFWLMVPILLLNVILMPKLPGAYQLEVFWRDIPGWIRVGENGLRALVFGLPLLMPLRIITRRQEIGLAVFFIGMVLYFLSWGAQIRYSSSGWSRSRLGFMAPGYTPLIWLTGVGLIGDKLFVPVPYASWGYIALSVAFLCFHNAHTWLVYSRSRGLVAEEL